MQSDARARELIESFAFFDDWEERYSLLLDMGRELPPLDPTKKTPDHLVTGCMSQVWVVPMPMNDADGRPCLAFEADSDSAIVKGLVAVLRTLLHGLPAEAAVKTNIIGVFRTIGLDQHLSMNRRNGFYAMVELLKRHAAALSAQ